MNAGAAIIFPDSDSLVEFSPVGALQKLRVAIELLERTLISLSRYDLLSRICNNQWIPVTLESI